MARIYKSPAPSSNKAVQPVVETKESDVVETTTDEKPVPAKKTTAKKPTE